MNELINLEKVNPIAVFNGEGLDPLLQSIKEEVSGLVPDLSTDKGRKEIASLANKVARSKTYLDGLGKDLVSEWKDKAKKVDSERKKMRDFLDNLKAEVRHPLTEWENAEKDRVAAIQERINYIGSLSINLSGCDTDFLENKLIEARNIKIDDSFAEFANDAAIAKDETILELERFFDERMKYESEQRELEKLRKEAEERAQRDREEALRKEGEEKARREAEEKAIAEKIKAKQEAERIENERLAAVQAQEAAERRAKEAEERAKQEAEEAIVRERLRVEKEKEEQERLAKLREADKEHKASINRAILAALNNQGVSDEVGKKIIIAIVTGAIPNTKITY
jgi:hypothetical protein